MGEKLEALETGEDLERKRNWEYTLEDNERWQQKLENKEERRDDGFVTYDHAAARKYNRDTAALKPDLATYREQRAHALGYDNPEAGSSRQLVHGSTSSRAPGNGSMVRSGPESLYRDVNSFVYADHKPSEEAIDRVIGQLNADLDRRAKRSRVRLEEEGEVNYINDKNKQFNRKLDRYFDRYTQEIRNSFERGTAL